jgi:thioesterase domain-containing protein
MNPQENAPRVPGDMSKLQQRKEQAAAPLVLLQDGPETPPIFMAPGIGDSAMNLLCLAHHMQVRHPIYGLEPRGMDGVEEPLDSVEAMAEFHGEAIRHLQPHGPYLLVGYSFGGLVTLEIARRLSASGEKVALLAMLDSHVDRHQLPLGQHAGLILRLARKRVGSLLRSSGHPQPRIGENPTSQLPLDESISGASLRVKECQYEAWRNYHPSFYNGKIRFVRAAIPTFFPNNPAAVWGHLANEFQVETIPGAHLEMLTTQLETLASVVTRYVREALAET